MSNIVRPTDLAAAARRRRRRPSAGLGVLLAAATLIVGCASTTKPATAPTTTPPTSLAAPSTTSPSTSTTQPSPSTTSFALYFLRGNYLGVARRNVQSTAAVGAAAVNALLAGPSSSEKTAGLSSSVPPGCALLGLSISSGTATANFNSPYATPASPASELQRVAEVVFTLTQFPTVNRVAFEVDGVTPQQFASGAVNLSCPIQSLRKR